MENKIFNVLVNFEGSDSLTSDVITLVKGDYNSVDLVFQFSKTGTLQLFYLLKPNGKVYVTAINDNRVTIDDPSIFDVTGRYFFGVTIYDEDSKLTNSKKCLIEVVDSGLEIDPSDIESDSNYQILDDLINRVEGLIPTYNANAEAKLQEFNTNASSLLDTFNSNYDAKLDGFNANALQIEEDAEETTGITFSEWGNSKRIEESIKNHFALTPDYGIYTVRFPLWETSNACQGEKLDANIGKSITPATDTVEEVNNYSEAWQSYDVNAVVDSNGVRHVTSIKGMPNFRDTGKVDVFCLFRTYYQKIWEEDGYLYISRSFMPRDGYDVVPQAINKDGTISPWFTIGKYVVGDIDGTLYSSKGLIPAHYLQNPTGDEEFSDSISYSGCVSLMHQKGSYYSAGLMSDYMHILTTFYLQFATKNTQSVLGGNTENNYQYNVSVAESNVSRVVLTTAQANNIDINTYVSVGDIGSNTDKDRVKNYIHNLAYDVKVIGKEVVDSGHTALILDHAPITTTATTWVSTMHERSGYSDDILGRTGSIGSNTNRKHGMVFNGIELSVGGYEVAGNAIMDIVNSSGDREVYYTNDASQLTATVNTIKSTYKKSDLVIQPASLNGWKYITEYGFDTEDGIEVPTKAGQSGSGSTVGYADALNVDSGTSGQREFLWLGTLNVGTNAGLCCLYANSGMTAAYWSVLARLSINGVGGELSE